MLGGANQGRGVVAAPWGPFAEGVVHPVVKVDEARLRDGMALVVVDPVPGEAAGSNQLLANGAISIHRQRQGRPGDRGRDLNEGGMRHAAGDRGAGSSPGRLGKADPTVSLFR